MRKAHIHALISRSNPPFPITSRSKKDEHEAPRRNNKSSPSPLYHQGFQWFSIQQKPRYIRIDRSHFTSWLVNARARTTAKHLYIPVYISTRFLRLRHDDEFVKRPFAQRTYNYRQCKANIRVKYLSSIYTLARPYSSARIERACI